MLNIILTSYNRPRYVKQAIESVICQDDPRWTLRIMDDNSDIKTRRVISEFKDHPQIDIHWHNTTPNQREASIRYSVLINLVLAELEPIGYVGYMTDNAQFAPGLVGAVHDHFERHPDHFSCYVMLRRVGVPADFPHPVMLPAKAGPKHKPLGKLDHSQVFHRLPVKARWPLNVAHKRHGDGMFFTDLVAAHGAIHPVGDLLACERWLE